MVFIFILLSSSCSNQPTKTGVSIISSSIGLMKNTQANFPIFLTDTLVNRIDLEKKYSNDIFIIHTGHILNPKLSKAENEANLKKLKGLEINLVNLTLEDFVVAESQGISFDNYDQAFLNSSIIDLNLDALATAKSITPYYVHGSMGFIGLSDNKIDSKLPNEKFIINDYVLSILKIKKIALKSTSHAPINSFILIHTLGNEINNIMERLPPSFINSLAD